MPENLDDPLVAIALVGLVTAFIGLLLSIFFGILRFIDWRNEEPAPLEGPEHEPEEDLVQEYVYVTDPVPLTTRELAIPIMLTKPVESIEPYVEASKPKRLPKSRPKKEEKP